MAEFTNPEGYEIWMGRWSARLAPAFADFAQLPQDGTVLDVGSGTGALATTILGQREKLTVVGVEPAESYVDYCRNKHTDRRLAFHVGSAEDLPFGDDQFDGTLALLILQELPDAPRAVGEMARVTRPGGRVAAAQWDFVSGLPLLTTFWQAVIDIVDTSAVREEAKQAVPAGYSTAAELALLWQQAGLVDVATQGLSIDMEFANFDDYWSSFLTGVSPTSSYGARLSEAQRMALKSRLRGNFNLKSERDPVRLPAHAWAVRGTVPKHPGGGN